MQRHAEDAPGGRWDFSDWAVVVTGGTRGVGRAIAEAFLSAGSNVMVCSRHEPEIDSLPMGRGGDQHRRAVFVSADVRQADQASRVVAAAAERFGRLDVLVNNAGGSPSVASAEAPPRFIASVVALNLLAPFYCAQAANAIFQAQPDGGSIINVGSVSGMRPSPGAAAYGAAKAGLVNLTRTLAVEWAPHVRVNCVSGGLLDTGAGPEHYGGSEGMERVAATVPLGRMGSPRDIAALCCFLASSDAAFVSGANLVADGGGEWPAYLRALHGRA